MSYDPSTITRREELDQVQETVFTWTKEWSERSLCIYDTSMGYWLLKTDIEDYVLTWDLSIEERENYLIDLKSKI